MHAASAARGTIDRDCPHEETACRFCQQTNYHPAFCPAGHMVNRNVPMHRWEKRLRRARRNAAYMRWVLRLEPWERSRHNPSDEA
ncbi:unnamed protein product [Heligmosomoides polygyrus]|uniref:ZnF_CHCC domain-containing protein n=1 Tax=Heligmosomoides polygyrus TaxID=6339 RepID=A0A183FW81_HELPZ|nr:unnamed protein product [Heligmosomoides polygyrus]